MNIYFNEKIEKFKAESDNFKILVTCDAAEL